MFLRGFVQLFLVGALAVEARAQAMQKTAVPAQPDGCLTMQQILRMQQSDLDATRLFLDALGWNFTGSSQDVSYRFMDRDLPYHYINWQHRSSYARVVLYYYPGKEQVVRLEPDEQCFRYLLAAFRQADGKNSVGDNTLTTVFKVQNLQVEFTESSYSSNFAIQVVPTLALTREARAQIAKEEAAQRQEQERTRRFREALQRGDEAYAAGQYVLARSAYRDAQYIDDNEDVRERIESCELAMCKAKEVRADSAYRAGNYELAKNLYYEARPCNTNKGNIDTKIRLMESKIKEQQVREAKEYADKLYEAKSYGAARNAYENLLRIDPGNRHAMNQISSIKTITQFLIDRGRTVFAYREDNASGLLLWKRSVAESLNRTVSAVPAGSIQADISLRFDTMGRNNSSFRIREGGTPDLDAEFQRLVQASVLSPPKRRGYFIAAKEDVPLKIQWSSATYSVWSDVGGLRFDNNFPAALKTDVERYINRNTPKYGNFRIQVKDKNFNDRSYTDLSLAGYKSKAGPGSAFYSLLWPGLGTYRASYGAQGAGAAKWFLYCAGTSVLSALYARAQYTNYQNATNQADMDYYFERANLGYKTALVSGGLAATIYVHNIFAAIHRGSRNVKESRALRARLQDEPISIHSQAITLP